MTTLHEAARMAMEALTNCTSEHGHRCNRCDSEVDEGGRVADALRAALAANEAQTTSEQGWLHRLDMEKADAWQQGYEKGLQRYSKANTRLTDYELTEIAVRASQAGGGLHPWWMVLCREVEARVRQENALDKLAAESQRLGLYDVPKKPEAGA
jgi:hypothetical protein